MPYKRPIEPFLWLLFSAGGTLSAMVLPALILLFGLGFPLGWIAPPSYGALHSLVGHPLARLVLFVLCSLGLVHGAHRFRYTLYDGLQIKHLNEIIDVACYGGAVLGTVIAAYLLITY
jgi:fumarate reductase subunit D